MSETRSLAEVVNKACELETTEKKVAWLKENNSLALRTVLAVMYDPIAHVWNIPNESVPPYTPSPHVESHGMMYRQARKLRYFIKGFDGDGLQQYRREFLFIEMLESIDKDDAKLMEKVLLQKPIAGLPRSVIIEAFGPIIPAESATPINEPKKRGRKPKPKNV